MTFSSAFKRSALLSLSASAVLATGCANMATTATSVTSDAGTATMTGKIYGGNQPVVNADVRLYQAGSTGYGSAGTLLADTTTDGNGRFAFTQKAGAGSTMTSTYGCPTTGSQQVYIIAKGGNTQGATNGANSAAAFIVALGTCSTAATSVVDLTETTTVATLAALQQYFSPGNANSDNTSHLGYPSTTQASAAFANAVGNIANLVNVQFGTVGTTTITGAAPVGAGGPVTVTVTPEISKINTLANILAACVNTTSSASANCSTLFTNAVPPNSALTSQPMLTFGAPVDTVQALYYMLTNPTSGGASALNALYALQSGAGAPFLPDEAAAPTDWTVGLGYSSTSACATGTANYLAYAYHLAVDANGNVWMVSNATGGNIFEMGPNGAPLACTFGGTIAKSTSLAIDTSSNVWVGSITGTNLYKFPTTTPITAATATNTWPTGETTGTQFITIDGAGDVVDSSNATVTTNNNIYQFKNGANIAVPFTATNISNSVGIQPYFLAADTQNRFWSTDSTTTNNFYDIYPSTASGNLNGYLTANVGSATSVTNGYGVQAGLSSTIATVDSNNSASSVSNVLSIFTPGATAGTATATFTSAQYAGGLLAPRELAIDGAGNIWAGNSGTTAGNYASGSTTTTLHSLSEFSPTGVAISPTGTSSSTTTVNGGFQKDANAFPVALRGIAIDPSGNVWTGSNSGSGASVSVLVGAAVPVVTPIASALAAGSSTANGVLKP